MLAGGTCSRGTSDECDEYWGNCRRDYFLLLSLVGGTKMTGRGVDDLSSLLFALPLLLL